MPTQWQTSVSEFRGGLISNLSPLQQGINAVGSATILQNFEPSLSGGYRKVLGYQKFDANTLSGSNNVQGVFVVNTDANTQVIAVRSGEYQVSSGSGWTSKGTATTTNASKVRSARYDLGGTQKMVFVDGANYPAYYNVDAGTLSFLASSAENDDLEGSSHVAFFKNALAFGNGTKLIISAPFTDTNFTAASGAAIIDVASPITGLKVFRQNLIIFSRDRIVQLTGSTSSDFAIQPITEDIGCIQADTIQEIGGDVIFMAPDGLRLLSATDRIGDFGLDVASKPIQRNYETFRGNATSFHSLVIREKAQYRIFGYSDSVSDDSAKGLLATKFVDQGGTGLNWAEMKGFRAFVCDSALVDDAEVIVFANNDGFVYQLERTLQRDSANVESIYQSPFMPINDPQVRKTFYKLVLYLDLAGQFQLTTRLLFDQESPTVIQPQPFTVSESGASVFLYGALDAVYGTATYSGNLDKVYNNNVIGSGKTVAIRIDDTTASTVYTLDTAVLEYATDDRQ